MDPTIIAAIIGAIATLAAAIITYIINHKRPPKLPKNIPKDRYRVIGFDLDGTLLRGLEFSWTLVWEYLDFPEAVRKAGMRRFITKKITYQEWCEWACEQFKQKGLKRTDFKKITEPIHVTKNLHEAIKILKKDGFIIGIISGGIDVFIHEKIPDAYELFDYIFINELLFDGKGLIRGVRVTPYDFAGKALALEKMCKEHGYTIENSVFVGEGFNDDIVATKAGLSIAYPPKGQGIRAAANVEIDEDDLLKILPYVLGT